MKILWKPYLGFALGLIFFLFAGFGVYWVVQDGNCENIEWRVYENRQFGLRLHYPENWQVREFIQPEVPEMPVRILLILEIEKPTKKDKKGLRVEIHQNTVSLKDVYGVAVDRVPVSIPSHLVNRTRMSTSQVAGYTPFIAQKTVSSFYWHYFFTPYFREKDSNIEATDCSREILAKMIKSVILF